MFLHFNFIIICFTASALIASAILRGQADSIDFNTQDSALAEMLLEQSE